MKKIILLTIGVLLATAVSAQKTPAGHFAWGAEVGGAIDMTANDMSAVSANAFLGYRNSWIDILGAGAGINVAVDNNCRTFPVYALFRSSFRTRPSLAFLDLKVGCAMNSTDNESSHSRLYLAPGVGFNLARGKNFQSYITLSYEYNGMKHYVKNGVTHNISSLSLAALRIGISF